MTDSDLPGIQFDDAGLFQTLAALSTAQLDALPFGVIGFDSADIIRIYNAPESRWAGLERASVMDSPMFEIVAPCMNNYLIAKRLKQALENHEALDATLDYVLTLRMRPTPCRLRLLAEPASPVRFILIDRSERHGT